jgi:hypothetical protein
MESILLGTARRRQAAMAKLAAAALFGLMAFLLLYGLQFLLIVLIYGTGGANAPASAAMAYFSETACSTVGSLFGMAALVSLAATLACAAAAALASALLRRHPLLSLLGFGLFAGVQMMLLAVRTNQFNWGIDLSAMPMLGRWLEQAVNMLPACVLASSDTLLNTAWNAGNIALGLGMPAALIVLTIWLAPRQFLRRRKA